MYNTAPRHAGHTASRPVGLGTYERGLCDFCKGFDLEMNNEWLTSRMLPVLRSTGAWGSELREDNLLFSLALIAAHLRCLH